MKIVINEVEPRHKVYKITETIENKFYIGKTSKPLHTRLSFHRYSQSRLLADAHFRNIGWEFVVVEIIDSAENEKELFQKEIENIVKYYQHDKQHILNKYYANDWSVKSFCKQEPTFIRVWSPENKKWVLKEKHTKKEDTEIDYEDEKIYYGC